MATRCATCCHACCALSRCALRRNHGHNHGLTGTITLEHDATCASLELTCGEGEGRRTKAPLCVMIRSTSNALSNHRPVKRNCRQPPACVIRACYLLYRGYMPAPASMRQCFSLSLVTKATDQKAIRKDSAQTSERRRSPSSLSASWACSESSP